MQNNLWRPVNRDGVKQDIHSTTEHTDCGDRATQPWTISGSQNKPDQKFTEPRSNANGKTLKSGGHMELANLTGKRIASWGTTGTKNKYYVSKSYKSN